MSEVVWDYQLIGGRADQTEFEVVLVAIKSDIIEALARAVEAAGLRVTLVDVSPLALYNSVRYNYDTTEGCTLVVDVGARTTNLLFIEQDKIFTRSIPIGGNTITQAAMSEFEEMRLTFGQAEDLKRSKGFVGLGGAFEEPEDPMVARLSKIIRNVMTRLHAEIARSVIFYRTQQGGHQPTKLLLAGGSTALPYTDHFFNEKLQVPVEFFNPFRGVDIDGALNRDALAERAAFYGGAVGLGLRAAAGECPIEVNLLPKSIIAQREFNRKKLYFAGAAVGLGLIGFSWSYFFDRVATDQTAQVGDLNHRIQSLRRLEVQMDKLEKTAGEYLKVKEEIKKQSLLRRRWLEIVDDLAKRLPKDTWIVQLQPGAGDTGARASAARPTGLMRGAPAEAPPEGAPPEGEPGQAEGAGTAEAKITELTIIGASIYIAKEPDRLQKPSEFLKELRNSPYFDKDATSITKGPTPKEGDLNFTFTIAAKLKEPIPL
jgi:type IV pilus assembly protein PilM